MPVAADGDDMYKTVNSVYFDAADSYSFFFFDDDDSMGGGWEAGVVTRRWMTWTCTTGASPRPLRRSGRSLGGRHPQPRTNLHQPLLLRCGLRGADVQHPHELGAPAPATSPSPSVLAPPVPDGDGFPAWARL